MKRLRAKGGCLKLPEEDTWFTLDERRQVAHRVTRWLEEEQQEAGPSTIDLEGLGLDEEPES
jgi:hypothetical protein